MAQQKPSNPKESQILNRTKLKLVLCIGVLLGQGPTYGALTLAPELATRLTPKPLVYGKHSMVVTNHPLASKAASKVLKQGGNAIDAAVAAAFVLGLVEPQSSGIGGGGYALVYLPEKQARVAYNGREMAPHAATRNLFLNQEGKALSFQAAMRSAFSIGIPGQVALLSRLHREHGKLPWEKLIEPARDLALNGFTMGERLHTLMDADKSDFKNDKQVQAVYFNSKGQVKPVGARIKNPEYALTLEQIAKDSAAFYKGRITKAIIKAVNERANKTWLSMSDFSQYQVLKAPALCSNYEDYEICSTPFESGGISVIELLKIISALQSKPVGKAPWYYLFLEASKLAYADREAYVEDPHSTPIPTKGLLSDKYIDSQSKRVQFKAMPTPIEPGKPEGAKAYAPDSSPKQPGTSSLSIVDQEGLAISMTLSIEHQFGSHLFVNGFFLNNQMTDFALVSKNEKMQDIINSPAPFKRPRSAMAPTMAFASNRLVALTGSPGGAEIICYVTKNLIQMLTQHLSPAQSAASGNLCSTNGPATIESNSSMLQHISLLRQLGETIQTKPMVSGMTNIKRRVKKGWAGAADPRREGMAIGN